MSEKYYEEPRLKNAGNPYLTAAGNADRNDVVSQLRLAIEKIEGAIAELRFVEGLYAEKLIEALNSDIEGYQKIIQVLTVLKYI